MSTFTAVVVTHANRFGLARILANLNEQTQPPDEVRIYCSGYPAGSVVNASCIVTEQPDMQDWGHEKRATGLAEAQSEWLGFFNDDDVYDQRYIEIMLDVAEAEAADVVYCAWNDQPTCDFAHSHSTAGNFICRTDLGRRAGYLGRHYEADGDFIEALKREGASVARVDEILYHHNAAPEGPCA